ncbi:unnamed protein product [Scytosiphon promiscuus]
MVEFEDMRVVDLRAELKTRGLPVSGLKAVLIQRLHDHDNSLAGPVAQEDGKAEQNSATAITETVEDNSSVEAKPSVEIRAPASAVGASEPAEAPAPGGKAVAPAAASPTMAAKEEVPSPQAPSAEAAAGDTKAGAEAPASAAAANLPAVATPSTALKSTRSKTRRASMASAAATQEKPEPAVKPEVSVEGEVAGPSSSAESVGAGASGSERAAAVEGEALDDNSAMQIRLAKGSGLLGVVISAACIGVGHGLTAGNLVTCHVALLGLFIAATASNRRPTGTSAFIARSLVTLAVALVASEAYQQRQRPLGAMPAETAGEESGMAALASFVSGKVAGALSCSGPPGEEDVGGGEESIEEVADEAAVPIAMEAWLAWAKEVWSVLEAGEWRAVQFGVIEFWGWASVAGYITLVEALPVILQPLHGIFRRLERVHNILLAALSLAMLAGIVRSCITSGKTSSVHAMLCDTFDEKDPVFDATSKAFFWSKYWEWFDTALLVAKGKPVSWLQYTHHASTAILTALNMVPTRNAMWSVVCALNSFVHAWMYAYYAFPRFRLLRRTKVWLTWAQMIQHMIVLLSAAYVVYLGRKGEECHNNTTPILAGLGLYLMYLAFFALFYRRTYVGGAQKRARPA